MIKVFIERSLPSQKMSIYIVDKDAYGNGKQITFKDGLFLFTPIKDFEPMEPSLSATMDIGSEFLNGLATELNANGYGKQNDENKDRESKRLEAHIQDLRLILVKINKFST